eukprot:1424449-Alexandrium_andersonii.AAC.1
MSASLVGSEMCIRDRPSAARIATNPRPGAPWSHCWPALCWPGGACVCPALFCLRRQQQRGTYARVGWKGEP